MSEILHITEDAQMTDTPINQPSMLSKITAVVSVVAFVFAVGGYIFVAGGQTQQLQKHEREIEVLQQGQQNHASKGDIQRLESKIDMIINNELQKQRK